MTDDETWTNERLFWTGGVEHYRDRLDPQGVMAFPAPGGIIAGPGIIDSLKGAPRWSSVDMSQTHLARPSDGLVVLGYKAQARRDDGTGDSAYCTSTYRRAEHQWTLVQHQQTPV